MGLFHLYPSFSQRVSEGQKAVLWVEDCLRLDLQEGRFAGEEQDILGREVCCEYGRVDLLLTDWVLEIKRADKWKEGVGQLMVYGLEYPQKGRWLHLYPQREMGKLRHPHKIQESVGRLKNKVEEACEHLGIRVTWADEGAQDTE